MLQDLLDMNYPTTSSANICLVLLCCVFLDELWLKILIDLFLLLLTRSGLFVFVVVLPGAMYEVEVATDVVLWVL